MKKLAIVTTHPIQYHAPLFKLLAKKSNQELKVFYTWSQTHEQVQDEIFGREIKWDIPLLEGYEFEFVDNISKSPQSNRWLGIDNPLLISRIKAFKPDALLVFGWKMKSHFLTMRYFKGKIPVWFRGDSTLLDEHNNTKTFFRRCWLTYIYRNVDKVFYVGQENKKYFIVHGIKKSQLIFAPHAIDNTRFYDSEKKKYELKAKEWRNSIGYSKDDFVILFAGKFERKKNLSILIQAVQKLNSSGDCNYKLILVGNGPLEQEIILEINKDKNITLIPFQNQSQMPIVYRLGNVFCLPSKGPGETWGLAVNEALASGCPVIVSDKVGCAADLISKETGRMFKSGDLKDLCDKIKEIQESDLLNGSDTTMIRDWNFEKICKAIAKELE